MEGIQSKTTLPIDILTKELQSPFTTDIGKGFSGSIKSVRLTLAEADGITTTKSRAVKVLPLNEQVISRICVFNFEKRVLEEAKREIRVFESLPSNPNVVHFYGAGTHEKTAYLVLEKAGNDCIST